MKITLNWLRDFVDIDVDVNTLAEKLVSAGFEVEEIVNLRDSMKNVVVGRVDCLEKHPNADKLQICKINVGNEIIQIVTGANNIKIGDLIPVAKDNSLLPNGDTIKKGKLRGVESFGMLCSGGELNIKESDYIGAEADGILILQEEYPLGTDMNEVLGNDDIMLDVSVLSNRPDCNSVLGLAREVCAVLNKELKMPNLNYQTVAKNINDSVKVTVLAEDLCPRYMAGYVDNIKIAPSPNYIKNRLKAVGIRPINNIVDITNYVLVEIGQPMHAFDYSLLEGKEIIVRRAKEKEEIITLDGKNNILDSNILVICDKKCPSAIAGIMGGEFSGIKNDTKSIVFESAKFVKDNVRLSSRKLNLKSDSQFRFERGIDLKSQELGIQRALALISELKCGDIYSGIIDVIAKKPESKILSVCANKINEILGVEVPIDVMVNKLNCLQIKTEYVDGNLICELPIFREDLDNANDIAEEIIRLYGYEHITCSLIDKGEQTKGGKSVEQKNIDKVKDILLGVGANEILSFSFTSPKMFNVLNLAEDDELRKVINLKRPLGEDLSIMRTTLSYSMLSTIASNILKSNRKGLLFEIANVYLPKSLPLTELPTENAHLIVGMFGEGDFYDLKGIVENIFESFSLNEEYQRCNISYLHTGKSAQIFIGEDLIGYIGEVHPTVNAKLGIKETIFIAELNLDKINEKFKYFYKFKEIPKYPSINRDIAIIVEDKVTANEIISIVKKAGGNMLVNCDIFDIYRGKGIDNGNKSVAISLEFLLLDRTLKDEEVNEKINKILNKLGESIGAKLR